MHTAPCTVLQLHWLMHWGQHCQSSRRMPSPGLGRQKRRVRVVAVVVVEEELLLEETRTLAHQSTYLKTQRCVTCVAFYVLYFGTYGT